MENAFIGELIHQLYCSPIKQILGRCYNYQNFVINLLFTNLLFKPLAGGLNIFLATFYCFAYETSCYSQCRTN